MNPWDNIDFDYPTIPTMISLEEIKYLYWLGARYWRDIGHVVEIGPWLGGSTVCLASGMRDNVKAPKYRLHAFDNFVWREFMARRASLPITDGDSFQAYFEKNLASFNYLVLPHRKALPDDPNPLDKMAQSIHSSVSEEIPTLHWDSSQPVEILFVDGAKSWTGLKYLLQVFNKALIPGKSLLVFQDYKFWGSYWVPMMLEYFMEYLAIQHNVAKNTISFIFKIEIPDKIFDNLPSSGEMDLDSGNKLLDQASRRLMISGDKLGALILKACGVRFRVNKGATKSAIDLFRKLEAEWPMGTDTQTITQLRNWLQHESGKRLAPSLRWRYVSVLQKIRNYIRSIARRIIG